MPQPYKPRPNHGTMSVSPRCVEERPACAIKIATIASAWTSVEGQMAMLFGGVTGETKLTSADTISHSGNFAAQAALGVIQSLAMRITVFRAATETILKSDEKAEFEELVTALRARAGERNDVVHGRWAIVEKYPNDLLLSISTAASPDTWLRYTEADFENIIVRTLEIDDRLMRFGARHTWGRMSALMPQIGDRPEPLPHDE